MRREPVIGHAEALRAVDTIRAELARREKTGVIAVADAHGELIALARLDGAPLSSIAVATNKAFTAARLRRSTREHGARIRERGVDIAYYGDPRYVGFGGGLPVRIGESVIGAVAVSGLSDDEDEALAALGVAVIVDAAARAAG
ncbi:MAG TPA: heme-binding protein [Casimicrobiaceae bacterium]|jgi:glc operon protein GlcG|nr:heme-binding protein [Casimicrobiaceae bacterium]